MTIDLSQEDMALVRAKDNTNCNVELKSIAGINITATIYKFKKEKKVIIINH